MLAFDEFEGVGEADAFEGLVFAGAFVVGVFDVEGGDVVGQQHDFVAEEVVRIFVRERAAGDAAQDVDDEVAGADAGVKYLHAGRRERGAKFALQDLFHAGTHEIHDLLRRVDDAVRIGLFDGEALEETFVDGVEEVLFLCPAVEIAGGVFDGDVEAVQRFEKFVAVEGAAGQGLDDLLDFGGDDVAIDEVGIVEDGAEEAFGEQVLHQHLIDGVAAHVGVKRGATEL